MNDSLNIFKQLNPWVHLSDTSSTLSDSTLQETPIHYINFLQSAPVDITPNIHSHIHFDFIIYILLFFLAGTALVRWYLPERFFYELSTDDRFSLSRTKSNQVKAPGLIIDVFFWLNFLFTTALLTYLLIEDFLPFGILKATDYTLLTSIFLILLFFWLYRRMGIKITAFIFLSGTMAERQLKLDKNTENALGVILLPILILALFSFKSFFIIAALMIAGGMQVFRWTQTIGIGISSTRFSALHFILYLCILELIPLILLFKLISTSIYL